MRKKGNNKIVKRTPWLVLFFVLFLTLGFATFTSTSSIIAKATVDPVIGIQIINFSSTGTGNHDGASNYETDNIDEVTTGAYLPYEDSTITYKIDLINLGTDENGIFAVTGLPNNLEYSFSSYNEQDKICDDTNPSNCDKLAKKTIYMTIKYKSDENGNVVGYNSATTTYPLTLHFDFRTFHTVTYTGFTGTYRDYVIDGGNLDVTFNTDDSPNSLSITDGTIQFVENTHYTYNNRNLKTLNGITKDINITAVNSIQYELDGGTNPDNQITTYTNSNNVNILDPTKTNYKFKGWYLNSSFTGDVITNTSQLSGNVTLYAKWEAKITTSKSVTELVEGNYVTYTDASGVDRECIVLYNSSDYGIQIITTQTVEQFEIGNGSGSTTSVNNTSNGSGTTKYATAVTSYNNARANLNAKARTYINTDLSPIDGARVVGTPPNNPDIENNMISSTTATYVSGKFRDSDTLYSTDRSKMTSLNIIDIDEIYWLGSYNHGTLGSRTSPLYMRIVKDDGNLSFYSILTPNTTSSSSNSRSYTAGLRPIFTLKDTIYINGGSGTKDDPYTLST